MKKNEYYTGEKAEFSGQYAVINNNEKSSGREITMVAGKIFPPLKSGEKYYRLIDKTKHQR